MPIYIVHRDGAFNMFSTISDTFAFERALTRSELEAWYLTEHGRRGMDELPGRIERAIATGGSGHSLFDGLDWMLATNRAGENEARLSEDECVRRFLTLPTSAEEPPA